MASLPVRRYTNPVFCRRERLHVLYIIANHKPIGFSVDIFHYSCRNKSALITPACWNIKIFISSLEYHNCKRQGQLTPSGNSSSNFFLVVLVLILVCLCVRVHVCMCACTCVHVCMCAFVLLACLPVFVSCHCPYMLCSSMPRL